MGTQFRCKRSGNVLTFNNPSDIIHVRSCESYEEIKNETNANEAVKVEEAPKAQVLKKRGRPAKVKVDTEQRISRPVNYVLNLELENKKLTDWCLIWKQKYEKLEQDYAQAKVMFLNSQAVVDYLENKVANLITINNLKGK